MGRAGGNDHLEELSMDWSTKWKWTGVCGLD